MFLRIVFVVAMWLIGAILLNVLFALYANAEPHGRGEESMPPPPQFFPYALKDGKAYISYTNQITSALKEQMETIHVPGVGDVLIMWDATTNSECEPACPDSATVWGVPDGFIVTPSSVILGEGDTQVFTITPYTGG
jgi:hypothetical protein